MEHVFDVSELRTFVPNGELSSYSEPKQVGFYSTDKNRQVILDSSRLRYYYKPPSPSGAKPMNVYVGFDSFDARDELMKERLDSLLKAILLLTEQKLQNKQTILKGDRLWFEKENLIMTWRGIMTKLLCTPYERVEDWQLDISRYRVSQDYIRTAKVSGRYIAAL
jgi:RAT1-interacting protein